jgi:hypothetical protein
MSDYHTDLEGYSVHPGLVSVDALMENQPFTYVSRQYASTLKIPYEAMRNCRTVEALKSLAKRQYRCLARKHHPDTSRAGQHRTLSQEFNRLYKAYRWFQQLQALPIKTARETIPEYPLPWSMEPRPLHFGYGWHETRL